MHNFGLDITPGIAASLELNENFDIPRNMGVALMNVPKLRETYSEFLEFIIGHVDNPNFKDSMSDQGAFLEFFEHDLRFLDKTFNVKPYWTRESTLTGRKIAHYHGLKPNDLLKTFLGYPLDSFSLAVRGIVEFLRDEAKNSRPTNACLTMHDFARAITSDSDNLIEFCVGDFQKDGKDSVETCLKFWNTLGEEEEHMASSCVDRIFKPMLEESVHQSLS